MAGIFNSRIFNNAIFNTGETVATHINTGGWWFDREYIRKRKEKEAAEQFAEAARLEAQEFERQSEAARIAQQAADERKQTRIERARMEAANAILQARAQESLESYQRILELLELKKQEEAAALQAYNVALYQQELNRQAQEQERLHQAFMVAEGIRINAMRQRELAEVMTFMLMEV